MKYDLRACSKFVENYLPGKNLSNWILATSNGNKSTEYWISIAWKNKLELKLKRIRYISTVGRNVFWKPIKAMFGLNLFFVFSGLAFCQYLSSPPQKTDTKVIQLGNCVLCDFKTKQ